MIAITAIVVAILSPVIATARSRAVSLTCTTRLSQTHTAVASYAASHRGELPTFKYPKYADGLAEAIPVPEWLDEGGWTILPFSETTFWAYQLREYIVDDPVAQYRLAVETMSCPSAFREWELHEAQHASLGVPLNAMTSMQKSYMKSIALFTEPAAWSDRSSTPDVNRVQIALRTTSVRRPSAKALLIERTSFHDHTPIDLIHRSPAARYNVLAVDGHVSTKTPEDATQPHGFLAAGTGLERPLVEPDRWRDAGIPFISTHRGANGNDW